MKDKKQLNRKIWIFSIIMIMILTVGFVRFRKVEYTVMDNRGSPAITIMSNKKTAEDIIHSKEDFKFIENDYRLELINDDNVRKINIIYPKQITITDKDNKDVLSTYKDTSKNIVAQHKEKIKTKDTTDINIYLNDKKQDSDDFSIAHEDHIRFELIEKKDNITKEEIDFKTIYQDDSDLEFKKKKTSVEGVKGNKDIIVTKTYIDGKHDKTLDKTSEKITKKPTNKVVKVGNVKKYDETIKFKTKYEQSNDMYTDQSKVKVAGVNGKRTVTKIYENAHKKEPKLIDTKKETIKKPTTAVVVKGTKKRPVVRQANSIYMKGRRFPIAYGAPLQTNQGLVDSVSNTWVNIPLRYGRGYGRDVFSSDVKTYYAHNYAGGDIIKGLQYGNKITVTDHNGKAKHYKVTSVKRHIPFSNHSMLTDMYQYTSGDSLLFKTCEYGNNNTDTIVVAKPM